MSSASPIYVDLAYIPNHCSAKNVDQEFFKRVRSSYYVVTGNDAACGEPSRSVLDALLDGKAQWGTNLQVGALLLSFQYLFVTLLYFQCQFLMSSLDVPTFRVKLSCNALCMENQTMAFNLCTQVTLIPTHDTEVTREWYQQTHERQQDLNIMVLASSSTVVMQDESFPACKIEF